MAADEPSLRPLKAKGVRQPRRSGICRLALFDNRAPDAGDAVERILAPQSRRCMEPKLADSFALSGQHNHRAARSTRSYSLPAHGMAQCFSLTCSDNL